MASDHLPTEGSGRSLAGTASDPDQAFAGRDR